ncbi:MAG: hypothetical protein LBT47_02365 [Deltaproteobacteria bacterium]|jgi:hypothetical protein|nr:hypothetical protein [Deltaproteobacteria bacterium]
MQLYKVMMKTTGTTASDFEFQTQQALSIALSLCAKPIEKNNGHISPELKTFSAVAFSLEKAVAVFLVIDQL